MLLIQRYSFYPSHLQRRKDTQRFSGFSFGLSLLIGVLLWISAPSCAYAIEMPDEPDFTFFTIGPEIPTSGGDWYSSRYGDNGYHYALIHIPCSWAGDQPVDIDLYSPEINYSGNTQDQTPDGSNYDQTNFELYSPNTEVTLPNNPAPSAPGSVLNIAYTPSDLPESWTRFHSIPTPVACGQYVLRTATETNDLNAWRLRVGLDNNDDPNDVLPTDYDLLPGTEDEIVLSTLSNLTAYVNPDPDFNCASNYQYIAPGLPSVTFHNFDLNQLARDYDASVRYLAPTEQGLLFALDEESLLEEGDPSASARWNHSLSDERSGDTFENPESGWWQIRTCASSGNRYIQEGQQNTPIYWSLPPIPQVEMTLDKMSEENDGPTYNVGDTINYLIRFTNDAENASPNPGRAYNLNFRQILPANMNYLSCTVDDNLSGNCGEDGSTPDGTGFAVNATVDELGIGQSGVVTVTAQIMGATQRNLLSGVSLEYTDSMDHRSLGTPASAIIALDAPTELILEVNNGLEEAQPGDRLTYAITVTNSGRLAARDVTVTNTLPSHVRFLEASNRGFETEPGSGIIKWPSVDIVGRTELRRTVSVLVDLPVAADILLENVAEIYYAKPTDSTQQVQTQATDLDAIQSGSIAGSLWRDIDSNGLFENTEPGLSELSVSVMVPMKLEPTFITTTTDARGAYHIQGLRAGEYVITVDTETLPPGFIIQGTNPRRVSLVAGESLDGMDLGFSWASSISGMIWNEIDEDGILGDREFVLEGVDVILLDEEENEIARTQTSSDGAYLFSGLNGGTYTIQVDTSTYPVELVPTHDPDLTPDSATSVTIIGDGGLSQLNFGYISYGSIGGLVWNDLNGNGDVESGTGDSAENPLADITMILLDKGGNEITRTVTADDGRYRFEKLKLDAYQIEIEQESVPENIVPTSEMDDVIDGLVVVDLAANIAADPMGSRDVDTANFGFVMPGSVVDSRLWRDLNGNNLYDEGEPGLADVILTLHHVGQDNMVYTATTDIDGKYLFENLSSGTYLLTVVTDTVPPGLQPSADPDDIPDGMTEFSLDAGARLDNMNFAYEAVALDIAVTDFGLTVTTEDMLPYEITYSNASELATGQVIVTNIVPENTTFTTQNSNSSWSCPDGAASGTVCTIELGSVPANTSGVISFSVVVTTGMPARVNTITNTVQIMDQSVQESIVVEDSVVTSVDAAPRLAIKQDDGRMPREPGMSLTYRIEYSNEGNQAATGVEIVQRVPQFTTFNSALSSPEWGCADKSPARTLCAVDVGELAAGAAGVLTFTNDIRAAFPVNVSQIDGLVTIVDDNGGRDEDPEVTIINSAPDLEIVLAADPGTVAAGNTIVYTLAYTNRGNQDAIGVLIVETVPQHTRFSQENSSTGWDCPDQSEAGTNCILTIGSVPAGVGGQVVFAVQVMSQIPEEVTEIRHSVVIAGSGIEQDIANNQWDGVNSIQDPLVIELLDFVAAPDAQGIRVQWKTGSETETWGFLLYRSTDTSWENAVRATPTLISGEGDERQGFVYTYIDVTALQNVTYRYWLQELEHSGMTHIYGPIQSSLDSPEIAEAPIENSNKPTEPIIEPSTTDVLSKEYTLYLPLVTR